MIHIPLVPLNELRTGWAWTCLTQVAVESHPSFCWYFMQLIDCQLAFSKTRQKKHITNIHQWHQWHQKVSICHLRRTTKLVTSSVTKAKPTRSWQFWRFLVFYGFPLWLYHINRVVISKTNKKTSIDESTSSKNIHDSNWILPKRTWHWKKTLQAFVALNHSIACSKNQAFELGCGPAATETLGCVPSWEQRCESQGFKCCTKSQSPSFFSSHGAE